MGTEGHRQRLVEATHCTNCALAFDATSCCSLEYRVLSSLNSSSCSVWCNGSSCSGTLSRCRAAANYLKQLY